MWTFLRVSSEPHPLLLFSGLRMLNQSFSVLRGHSPQPVNVFCNLLYLKYSADCICFHCYPTSAPQRIFLPKQLFGVADFTSSSSPSSEKGLIKIILIFIFKVMNASSLSSEPLRSFQFKDHPFLPGKLPCFSLHWKLLTGFPLPPRPPLSGGELELLLQVWSPFTRAFKKLLCTYNCHLYISIHSLSSGLQGYIDTTFLTSLLYSLRGSSNSTLSCTRALPHSACPLHAPES